MRCFPRACGKKLCRHGHLACDMSLHFRFIWFQLLSKYPHWKPLPFDRLSIHTGIASYLTALQMKVHSVSVFDSFCVYIKLGFPLGAGNFRMDYRQFFQMVLTTTKPFNILLQFSEWNYYHLFFSLWNLEIAQWCWYCDWVSGVIGIWTRETPIKTGLSWETFWLCCCSGFLPRNKI